MESSPIRSVRGRSLGVSSGLGAQECDGLLCRVVPVPVVIRGAGVEEDEPGEVRRALGLDEHFREYGLSEPVDRDNVQAPVLHERGNGVHGVQELLRPDPKRLLLRPGASPRRVCSLVRGTDQVIDMSAFGLVELQRTTDAFEDGL